MMDKELLQPSQSEQAASGAPPPSPTTPATPTPPRLTPNPMLLDSPAPLLTPSTSSPPPPLTPAPSLSSAAAHRPKAAAAAAAAAASAAAAGGGGGALSPHILVPAPPKLTSTSAPPLRTYSRPILPSPSTKKPTPLPSPSSSSSSSSSSSTSTQTKTAANLTNGSSRPGPISTAITPFHTPASPTGRQVSQVSHPGGTPGPARANQSPSPARQRVSQQALLLGKGLKGSGQDQVLLRAQMLILTSAMRPASSSSASSSSSSSSVPPSNNPASAQLQSLTLRPPPPGALTIPPSLRLKPPASITAPLSRPSAPSFPPLRPRPQPQLQPNTSTAESPTPPCRHLPVPPPSLYSPVRAVPLKPRLHPPNSPRLHPPPRPASALHPIAAAPLAPSPVPVPRVRSATLPQKLLGPAQVLSSSPNPLDRPPSAARQLQIIALSSGRQPAAMRPPDPPVQSKKSVGVGGEDGKTLLLNPPKPPPPPPVSASPTVPQRPEGEEPEKRSRAKVKEEEEEEAREAKRRKLERDEKEVDKSAIQTPTQTAVSNTVKDPREEQKPSSAQSAEQRADAEAPPHSQGGPESQREQQPAGQEDFCENMSTQSDNQSAVSSLSSQSPPSSPLTPAGNPPPLVPPESDQPTDLSLSHQKPPGEKLPQEPLDQSQHEPDQLGQSESSGLWEPREWPEGRQVLTHLVEGFVIQEGLQPFPVNRSSLLVPDQVTKAQEVNGTNGKLQTPTSEITKQRDNSTDSEGGEEEGGEETDRAAGGGGGRGEQEKGEERKVERGDAGTKPTHRDRTVLHCQFCGKRGHAHNFMRSKRFCSTACARGFNVRLTKRLRALSAGGQSERPRPALNRAESVPGKPLLLRLPRDLWSAGRREKEVKEKEKEPVAAEEEEEEDEEEEQERPEEDEDEDEEEDEGEDEEEEEDEEGHPGGYMEDEDDNEEDRREDGPAVAMTTRTEQRAARRPRRASAPAVTTSTPTTTFKPPPGQWSVEEVTAFIHTLPGCGDVAEAFRVQEIDGQALLLLTEDHLMSSMNIKLGPALKICAHINALKNQ